MKTLYHSSQLWEGKIDVWLHEMKMLTTYDLYDPLHFKDMVLEHMTKALCKDIDTILESLLYLAKSGIDFRESFYIIRAVEKLSVDWKNLVSFLKITETLILIIMVYTFKPQRAMSIAVVLAENFKINSKSFDEEIRGLKLFLPVVRLAGISFENIVKEYKYSMSEWKRPSRVAIDIRRKYYKAIEKAAFVEREGDMKNWIKVWWHCLIKLVMMMKNNHRMSTLTVLETKKVYHFCSCGYLEPDFPGINWNGG